jgi:hypothetical protein
MKKFNQSIRLGETDVSIETVDRFYDFNQTMQIVPPEEALKALSLSPSSTSAAIAV